MELNDFKNNSRENFSRIFLICMDKSNLNYRSFGEQYTPENPSNTIFYYFKNNPNASIYSIIKCSCIFNVDPQAFFDTQINAGTISFYEKPCIKSIDEEWNSFMNKISKFIIGYREKNKITKLNLEVLINMDNSDLGKIEKAKKNITINTLSQIAFLLNVSIEEMLSI